MWRFLICAWALAFSSWAQARGHVTDLQPSGPWKVEYADTNCVLSRTFTGAGESYEFELTLEPVVKTGWLRIGSPGKVRRSDDGNAQVDVDGIALAAPIHFNLFQNSKHGTTRQFLFPDFLKQVGGARASLRLRPGKYGDLFFRVPDFPQAVTAMSGCIADLHKSLGIDPALLQTIASPPQGNLLSLIEIPKDSLLLTVTLLFWVAPNGSVDDCRVLVPSGRAELDSNICSRLLREGRYQPATNAAGVAIRAPVYEGVLLRRQIVFEGGPVQLNVRP
jgi:TonB family protein